MDNLTFKVEKTAMDFAELLNKYNNSNNLKRTDFLDLTLLLLNYWGLEDDLSTAFATDRISFEIEEKIIELGNQYM